MSFVLLVYTVFFLKPVLNHDASFQCKGESPAEEILDIAT